MIDLEMMLEPLRISLRQAGEFLPRLAIALVVLIVGWILAKVARDEEMQWLHWRYPGYGFARHKGYPTADHRAALARLGPCAEHRRSFRPVQDAILRSERP